MVAFSLIRLDRTFEATRSILGAQPRMEIKESDQKSQSTRSEYRVECAVLFASCFACPSCSRQFLALNESSRDHRRYRHGSNNAGCTENLVTKQISDSIALGVVESAGENHWLGNCHHSDRDPYVSGSRHRPDQHRSESCHNDEWKQGFKIGF